jgi:hypothetical protein
MTMTSDADQAQTTKVRPMVETDHADADRVMRMAFGTFLGLPDPMGSWVTVTMFVLGGPQLQNSHSLP